MLLAVLAVPVWVLGISPALFLSNSPRQVTPRLRSDAQRQADGLPHAQPVPWTRSPPGSVPLQEPAGHAVSLPQLGLPRDVQQPPHQQQPQRQQQPQQPPPDPLQSDLTQRGAAAAPKHGDSHDDTEAPALFPPGTNLVASTARAPTRVGSWASSQLDALYDTTAAILAHYPAHIQELVRNMPPHRFKEIRHGEYRACPPQLVPLLCGCGRGIGEELTVCLLVCLLC